MYDKNVSKINIAKSIAEELPTAPNISYFLCDSWYVCGKVMDAFIGKGFYTVGALKTNRTLYPYGTKLSVSELAEKLSEKQCKELFYIVTVKGRKYYVYRYEGDLNGIQNAAVLLCYPVDAFGKKNALRTFVCTNAALSDNEILNLYALRWKIEVYFRDCKTKLAFDKYQIRSEIGIKNYWLIASLAHLIACFEDDSRDFSKGFSILAEKIHIERITFVYDFVKNGGEKSELIALIA